MPRTSEDLWKATAVNVEQPSGVITPPDLPVSGVALPSLVTAFPVVGSTSQQTILQSIKNWVTNPTADVNANNWVGFVSAGSTVISWSNTGNPGGAIRNVATPTAGGAVLTFQNFPDSAPVKPGNVLTLQADVNVVSGTFSQLILCARTHDASGNFIAQPTVQLVSASTTGVWNTLKGTFTVPAGVAFVSIHVQVTCPNSAAITFDVDNGFITAPIPEYTWLMQYIPAAGVWVYLGGTPLVAEIQSNTSETTTSTSYVDLTTVGPQVTVPRAGDYLVTMTALVNNGTASSDTWIAVKRNAAATADVDGVRLIQAANAGLYTITRTKLFTGLSALDVLKLQYRSVAGPTGGFMARSISVIPVRLT